MDDAGRICAEGLAVPANAAGRAARKASRAARGGVYPRFILPAARPPSCPLGERGQACEVRGMSPLRLIASLAAPLAFAAALPAQACSVVAGYRAPTNLELAAGADAIVLGQVAGGTSGLGPESTVTVRPLAALKGLLPGQEFPLGGMSLAPEIAPSDPLELEAPHPDALAGACIRRNFAPGATVLFFLDRSDGQWVPAGGPFSRWAEDVAGLDSPWVQLTAFYVRVAALEPDQRNALLEAERDAFQARADDPAAVALAADLDRSLAVPLAAAPAATPEPDDGFRRPGDVTAVQRALDAMRADGEER
jgi:hypothetical protein